MINLIKDPNRLTALLKSSSHISHAVRFATFAKILSHPSQNFLPAHYYSSRSTDQSYIFIFGATAQKENGQ